MSAADLRNLCCLSRQDHADISRVVFATARLPLDGIWGGREPLEKGRLWLFLKSVQAKMRRRVWAYDTIKEIAIYDDGETSTTATAATASAMQKNPYAIGKSTHTIRRSSYILLMASLLRVMETLTDLRVFR
ncbi:MAG: hypothetical protein M1840_001475 [Geoglossum simile]|nr:MAG: hypothetical protein M1840_001475 [Geoglossum simile]